jgi:hypothetical protein
VRQIRTQENNTLQKQNPILRTGVISLTVTILFRLARMKAVLNVYQFLTGKSKKEAFKI